MKIIDISRTISENTPTYPGDPATLIERVSDVERGNLFTLSRIVMGTHTGTHVDSPTHLIPGGGTVTDLPLDILIGPCQVIQVDSDGAISPQDLELEGLSRDVKRLLIKTTLTTGAHLEPNTADWLIDQEIALVGIDGLSVDSSGSADLAVHRKLLETNVIIVENLDLTEVTPDEYTLICLPLKIENADGAPVRAVLLQEID